MSASLDGSLDAMEEMRFRKKYSTEWNKIAKNTHFTFDELEHIMLIFYKIQRRDAKPGFHQTVDHILRLHFREVLHSGLGMTDAFMLERVMVALDRGTSPYVNMETFANTFSLYMRGTLDEKMAYCFTCYDVMGEGCLRRETMYQLLKKSLIKASPDDDVEETIKEMVDIMLKRMDADGDGCISQEDYELSVRNSPQLLQSLGRCLPDRQPLYAFVATFCPKWGKM